MLRAALLIMLVNENLKILRKLITKNVLISQTLIVIILINDNKTLIKTVEL